MAGAAVHRPRDLLDLTPSRRDARCRSTNILRTLCDLGALDAAAVPGAVGHVVTTGLASPAALRRGRSGATGGAAGPVSRRCGTRSTTGCSTASRSTASSSRRCADCSRGTGLPPAEFHPCIGGYEVDFRIVDSPIVLECDGWTTHGLDKRRSSSATATRDADLAALGFVVLRFTYREIMKRPARTAERIRRNLAALGAPPPRADRSGS